MTDYSKAWLHDGKIYGTDEWRHININRNQIDHETAKAYLISMPHKSDYKGFKFWISKKLVRDGRNSAAVQLSFKDDFIFNLKRTSDKTFRVLDEKNISAEDFMQQFGVTDENISAPNTDSDIPTVETKEAPKLEDPGEIKVIDDLKNE